MKTFTDGQLKQVLAKMLPEALDWREIKATAIGASGSYFCLCWKHGCNVLDTELLHICWLIERKLKQPEYETYPDALCLADNPDVRECAIDCDVCHWSWQQRATALAKVQGVDINPLSTTNPNNVMKTGIELITEERNRQMMPKSSGGEGWTPEHDDAHNNFQLSLAAASYCIHAWKARPDAGTNGYSKHLPGQYWPWEDSWWKPKDPLRDLIRAGALIAAEIDRIQRQCPECGGVGGVDSGGVTPWGSAISIPCPSCSTKNKK